MKFFEVVWKGTLTPQVEIERPEMRQLKWVDKWSTNAKYICTTYIPAVYRKLTIYSMPKRMILPGLRHVINQLRQVQYPTGWYKYLLGQMLKMERTGIG